MNRMGHPFLFQRQHVTPTTGLKELHVLSSSPAARRAPTGEKPLNSAG
jgi:hypothetical protein